jgi:hypothetical protein
MNPTSQPEAREIESEDLWTLVPPKPWMESESGLVLANKADIRDGRIPRLVGGWHSGDQACPPDKWIAYSEALAGRSVDQDEAALFVDEICIENQSGHRKQISVPRGSSTYFYACGPGIYCGSYKLVFLNVSPHSWCGIANTSLVTVDMRTFSCMIQNLGEPGFVRAYLKEAVGDVFEAFGCEIDSWSNSEVAMCLLDQGERLLIAAESPELTLELRWTADGWQVIGHKVGLAVSQDKSSILMDMDSLGSY